jgi:Protein of unknown function (DUF3489)
MAKQPKLNDLQLVLLSTASQREDGNLLPLPESIADSASRAKKAIENLIKRGFAAEADAARRVPSWREDGDRRIGAFITAQGKVAIGTDDAAPDEDQQPAAAPSPPPPPAVPARKPGEIRAGTKQALLVEMLERTEGASIQEIVDATGWLPHTTRAALTGLKKRGFEVTSEKVDGVGRYHAKRPA